MSYVFYNAETDDLDEVLHRKCKCGHELYEHGFNYFPSSIGYPHQMLIVSQCAMCPVDVKNNKFSCEEFDPI